MYGVKDAALYQIGLEMLRAEVPGHPRYFTGDSDLIHNLVYARRYCPEILAGGLRVLDIGTGPGAFLVLARLLGNRVIGIDQVPKGRLVLAFQMLTKACRLKVEYCGMPGNGEHFETPGKFNLINCQSAINCIYRDSPDLHQDLASFLATCLQSLAPGGTILVFPNAEPKGPEILDTLQAIAPAAGMVATPVLGKALRLTRCT